MMFLLEPTYNRLLLHTRGMRRTVSLGMGSILGVGALRRTGVVCPLGGGDRQAATRPITEKLVFPVARRLLRRLHPIESPLSRWPSCPKRVRSSMALYGEDAYLIPELASVEERRRTVTIVFDLDETLVNNRGEKPVFRPYAMEVLKKLRGSHPHPVYSKDETRDDSPNESKTEENKKQVSEVPPETTLRVELVLWTASIEKLAKPVLHLMDPSGVIFDQAIYLDEEWLGRLRRFRSTKALDWLGRDMDRVVIVENCSYNIHNRRNGILVKDFWGKKHESKDRVLLQVLEMLEEWMKQVQAKLHAGPQLDDIRVFIPQHKHIVSYREHFKVKSPQESSDEKS